jgi:hypothetical protein
MTEQDIKIQSATLPELADGIQKIQTTLDMLEAAKALYLSEIAKRTKDQLAAKLAAAGKTQGEVTGEVDGVKLVYSCKPKITWDSKRLQDVASSMTWDKVEKIFSIKFSVKETTYKALTDDALIAALNDARTVEHTEPKITLA